VQDLLLKAVGDKIRTLRREKGWSQDEFEDITGLHRAYIGAMERGEKNLTLKTLKTVADALGVHIRDLVRDV
jgi:transcriptional regulator with XRE-family HTH domain